MSAQNTPKRDGFQTRSGCFECACCGRQTRRTAKQQNGDLCPQCDQWSMIENGLSDGCYESEKEVADAEAQIVTLKEDAAKRGGDRARLGLQATGSAA